MHSSTFADRQTIAAMTARMLLEIDAVHFAADAPYIFTSGLASPVYIDCRKIISYPRVRETLTEFAVSVILREVGFEAVDAVAGGETAGIPFAAWIAHKMGLPMQYVRKKPKGFGRDAQIEGAPVAGKRVLLVEDLATDGGSKLRFAQALRDAGAGVTDTFVMFYYDIFPGSRDALEAAGLRLHALATWADVLAAARAAGEVDAGRLGAAEAFLGAPLEWSAAHGGAAALAL